MKTKKLHSIKKERETEEALSFHPTRLRPSPTHGRRVAFLSLCSSRRKAEKKKKRRRIGENKRKRTQTRKKAAIDSSTPMADIDALVLGSLDPSASQQHHGGSGSQLPGASGSDDVSSDMARLKRVRLILIRKIVGDRRRLALDRAPFDLLLFSPPPSSFTPPGLRQRAPLPRSPPLRARTRLSRPRGPDSPRKRSGRPRKSTRRRSETRNGRLRRRGLPLQVFVSSIPPCPPPQGRGLRSSLAGHPGGLGRRELCPAVPRRGGACPRLLFGDGPPPQAGRGAEAAAGSLILW